ncbi:MAG: hypothetical protein R2991_11530 [Thermoanaerobaculia bacterium]
MRQEEIWADLPIVVVSESPPSFDDRVLAARFAIDDLQEEALAPERLPPCSPPMPGASGAVAAS